MYDAENDAVWTTLLNQDGSVNYISLADVPYPGTDIRPSSLSIRGEDYVPTNEHVVRVLKQD